MVMNFLSNLLVREHVVVAGIHKKAKRMSLALECGCKIAHGMFEHGRETARNAQYLQTSTAARTSRLLPDRQIGPAMFLFVYNKICGERLLTCVKDLPKSAADFLEQGSARRQTQNNLRYGSLRMSQQNRLQQL